MYIIYEYVYIYMYMYVHVSMQKYYMNVHVCTVHVCVTNLCMGSTFVSLLLVVLLHNGEVYAFGNNVHGQIGQGNTKPR